MGNYSPNGAIIRIVRRAPIFPQHPTRRTKTVMTESEYPFDKPSSSDLPLTKASWSIQKSLRETPGGMSTDDLVVRVRENWPDEKLFEGKEGWRTVSATLAMLKYRGLVVRGESA